MAVSSMLRSLRGVLGRLETRTLIGLTLVAASAWAFLSISDEVAENETAAIDESILLAFRAPGAPHDPLGPRTFEEAMRDVTALGGFTILTLLTVVVTATLLFYGKRRHALVLGATILLAQAAAEGAKLVFGRPRPDLVPHASYVYSHSFPSGHSTMAAATFLTIAAILSSLEPHRHAKMFVFSVAVALTVAVGLSRVYLGVHWPSDVLGGWTLGAAFALAARLALSATRQAQASR